jgi:murein tripeptide amidase MpaA
MRTYSRILSLAVTGILMILPPSVRGQYLNHNQASQKIEALGKQNPAVCSVTSLSQTAGGNDIWLITIGTGPKDSKPGIAIIGGVDGKYLLGRELALGFAEKILNDAKENEIKEILDKVTFYIFPDVNPDASAQYFSGMKYERIQNSRSVDEDRDFLID